MRCRNFFCLFVCFFVFLICNVYALGLYDVSGDFVHYVSSPSPIVNVTIKSPNEAVNVSSAVLEINGVREKIIIGDILGVGEEKGYLFSSSDFGVSQILPTDDVFFDLLVFKLSGEPVTPIGDPVSFELSYDNEKPFVILPQVGEEIFVSQDVNRIDFLFNEKIGSFRVRVNGKDYQYVNPSSFFKDYSKEFRIDFGGLFFSSSLIGKNTIFVDEINKGVNTFEVFFTDLAGNSGSGSFTVFFSEKDYSVKLLTQKDKPTLNYYYDEKFKEMYEGTIYSQTSVFTLEVETSRNSNCFYSTNLVGFSPVEDVVNKVPLATTDRLSHSVSIDIGSVSKIWIACSSIVSPDDVVYLHDMMGLDAPALISVKQYVGDPLLIDGIYPGAEVTGVPFDTGLETNVVATCILSVNNGEEIVLNSDDFLTHDKAGISLANGIYSFRYRCYDLLGRVKESIQSVDIDTNRGVRITSFVPKYSDKADVDINLTLSEDAVCKYSDKKERMPDSFDSLRDLEDSGGVNRRINDTLLVDGVNEFYIYCLKANSVNENRIEVVYDTRGPILRNLTFVNNGFESNYVSSLDEVRFSFEVDSRVPVNKYFVEIEKVDSSIFKTIKSTSATIKDNLTGARKIRIVGQNVLGRNSSALEKVMIFDLDEPLITFTDEGDFVSIKCSDVDSSCVLVKYGLSDSSTSCRPTIDYDLGEKIDVSAGSYICVEGYDEVGNRAYDVKTLVNAFAPVEEIVEEVVEEVIEEVEEEVFVDEIPFGAEERVEVEEPGVSFILIVSLIFVFVGIAGGGFYVYKKGYLDEELRKLGILKKREGERPVKPSGEVGRAAQEIERKVEEEVPISYDEHLAKIKRFIQRQVKSKGGIFEKFKTPEHKGKVKGYEDTLIKKKKVSEEFEGRGAEEKKPTFEETIGRRGEVKEEAEKFEEFYKKKKKKGKK